MKLTNKFPSISRYIPESKVFIFFNRTSKRLLNQSKSKKVILYLSSIITSLLILILIFGTVQVGISFTRNLKGYIELVKFRQGLESQINFWSSVEDRYPGYKDAYFQMGYLEYQLGNFDKASDYIEKVLVLDPSDINANRLKKLLDEK